MDRLADLARFYDLLNHLEHKLDGKRRLADCHGRMDWPDRGVYFFFESGEARSDNSHGPRVIRVGTHALKAGSKTTLWKRLSQHKGNARSGGGNHRGSIFRLLVGTALIGQGEIGSVHTWGIGADLGKAAVRLGISREEVHNNENDLEIAVTNHIGLMPFLWLKIDDLPGPESDRGFIERNSIALLSNFYRTLLDTPSVNWLGQNCDRERVRLSGLWNNNHVSEDYDPSFLLNLGRFIDAI